MDSMIYQVDSIATNVQGCQSTVQSGDSQEIAAWKRVSKLTAGDAAHDAKEWEPLDRWGQGLRSRAASYPRADGLRQMVRAASGDIDIGASDGESALDHVSIADREFSKLQCSDPQVQEAKADRVLKDSLTHLGDGFEKLELVLKDSANHGQ